MRDLDFRDIPAVDRLIARDELANQVSELEAELAKQHADAADLARQLTSAQDACLSADERLAEVTQKLKELQCSIVERDAASRALEEAHAGTKSQLEGRLAEVTQELRELQTTLVERDATMHALEQAGAESKSQFEALRRQLEELRDAQASEKTKEEEIATCRALANRCVFVVGFGRSNTTITLDILNCAANALLLGEANFFLNEHGDNFSASYNRQHCEFQNQVSKSTHAPDFMAGKPHKWWQWLDRAAQVYDYVGEKIAFSDFHLRKMPPDAFRAFHEARFLKSRYIFMLRNPIDVLLSSAKMRGIIDDTSMAQICTGWLDFMQLWADFVRVFPSTMTVIRERFDEATVKELEAFTGLELGDAHLLISPTDKRRHKLTGKFPTLLRLRPELEDLYREAIAAVDENRALWQAEQKRNTAANEDEDGSGPMTTRPLGRVWLHAGELRSTLGESLKQAAE